MIENQNYSPFIPRLKRWAFWRNCRKIDACEDIKGFITSLQQEQPEVDLDAEIDKFLYGTKFKRDYDGVHVPGVCVRNWKGKKYTNRDVTPDDMRNFARHFAEWGSIHLNAKRGII